MWIAHGAMLVWRAAVWPPQGLSHSDTGGTDDITGVPLVKLSLDAQDRTEC